MSDSARLASLRKQHAELDDKIEKQERSPSTDHLAIVEVSFSHQPVGWKELAQERREFCS